MNERIDELFNDAHFRVTAEEIEYDVIPSLDKGVSVFLIILDGVELGTLEMDENEQWLWSEGNLTQGFADAIGCEIQKHYD